MTLNEDAKKNDEYVEETHKNEEQPFTFYREAGKDGTKSQLRML